MGQLNELQIKAAQPRDKEYMLSDGEGLYLRVRLNGKVWIYRYKHAGQQAKLSFGPYPTVTLAVARRKARGEAEKRAGGIDPRDARREQLERDRVSRLNTFELMARAWHAQAHQDRQWSAGYAEKVMRHLELHIFPWLGTLIMEAIKPTELVRCLHRIKERGNLETAQRVREAVQHVFQYAVDVGALDPAKNFVNSRTGGLPAPRARHYPAITDPEKLGQLLRDIQGYKGHVITRAALQLSPMLFQRPGQLRLADWEDINFEQAMWRCPPEKMKLREWMKRDTRTPAHLVPLPTQALEILRDIYPLTGPAGPIFRSMAKRSEASRHMSDNTINSALRTLGYDTREQITGHGFRATARTLIRELLGWDREIIERHLAHVSDEELGGSYDRTTFLDQRRKMIQLWADLLDDLAAGKAVALATDLRRSTSIEKSSSLLEEAGA
ncbi:MAG TPA: integrase arm-type DNA-binding domain-containing protein [Polaromonas sp.]|uniref:tyrosine-type recombinase/integrase n=1 Tax=Polaromonas sp. TaxID=1869339 RepID=UPI002D494C9A|nr:integrase arm-type DNA-binding domain-containing protein [Polaromonas sp.]HYW55761.1 integrase arm-type DNA-binding domain-containing protein [Polaromonas sp.]